MVSATVMSARALRAVNGEILDPYEVTNPGDYSAEELRQIDVARAAWLRMERRAAAVSKAAEKKRARLTAVKTVGVTKGGRLTTGFRLASAKSTPEGRAG